MRVFRRESGFYVLALVLGMVIRLIGLGTMPLSDQEASLALQALDVTKGASTILGSQPAYVALTSILFFALGGATNYLARLVPALAGSALVLLPALFRERLKQRPALILAFFLTLEPGLTALSRQAGSAILVLTFALAAWGFLEKRKMHWAGVSAGMALLSGPALWPGLLGLGIAWALLRPMEREVQVGTRRQSPQDGRAPARRWLTAGWYALGTVLLIGTVFMTVPAALSAWAAGIPEYFSRWTRASDISIGVMLASLVAYQPLGLLLAAVATIRGWIRGSVRIRRLSIWMIVALLLALFNPSRQVVDLVWMLVPLLALASLELGRHLDVRPIERREVLGAAALTFLILAFVWLDFLALRRPGIPLEQATLRGWLLAGSLLLLLTSLLLVGVGWSLRIARFGAVWGLVAFLGVYSFAALMSSAGHRRIPNAAEMWWSRGRLPMAGLLLETVREQSEWSNVDANAQSVTIAGLESPALEWLLRDREVEVRATPGAASKPPMVITADQEDAALAAAYRGQSFVWRSVPDWKLFEFSTWLPYHEMLTQDETIILWVRGDLFADTMANSGS